MKGNDGMSSDRDSMFLRYLRASELLDEEQWQQVSQISQDAADDDGELAKRLVAAKLLTPYQAKQVLAGRVKGFVIGPYTIQDRIGAGGMGQVFKAVHRDMGRTVALKVMAAALLLDMDWTGNFYRAYDLRKTFGLKHGQHTLDITFYFLGVHHYPKLKAEHAQKGESMVLDFLRLEAE